MSLIAVDDVDRSGRQLHLSNPLKFKSCSWHLRGFLQIFSHEEPQRIREVRLNIFRSYANVMLTFGIARPFPVCWDNVCQWEGLAASTNCCSGILSIPIQVEVDISLRSFREALVGISLSLLCLSASAPHPELFGVKPLPSSPHSQDLSKYFLSSHSR